MWNSPRSSLVCSVSCTQTRRWRLFCRLLITNTSNKRSRIAVYNIIVRRAQNTRRHAALCRAAAVICREALKMCGKCAARLAAMPWLSKSGIFRNRRESPCQTDNKPEIFIFTFTCMMLSVVCHQSSRANHRFPNCMSWSLDGSEDVCCHLVIKTCTASSYLARHGNCAALQTRTHAEKRKKT